MTAISLAEAEAAEAEQARQDEAASLAPALRQQRDAQRAADERRQQLERAERDALAACEKARRLIPEQRGRFMEWAQQGSDLAKEAGEVQTQLAASLSRLAGAVRRSLGRSQNPEHQETLALRTHDAARPVFERIGAMDLALMLFPAPGAAGNQFAKDCLELFQRHIREVYQPEIGAQQFRKSQIGRMITNQSKRR